MPVILQQGPGGPGRDMGGAGGVGGQQDASHRYSESQVWENDVIMSQITQLLDQIGIKLAG